MIIQQGTAYRLVCYNCRRQQLESFQDWELVDWVKCDSAAHKAPVLAEQVEHAANEAVQQWATEQQISLDEITKLSAVYLLPTPSTFNRINTRDIAPTTPHQG